MSKNYFTLRCSSCASVYHVTKRNRDDRQYLMLEARPRCIMHIAHPGVAPRELGLVSEMTGPTVFCGALLGPGSPQGGKHPVYPVSLGQLCGYRLVSTAEIDRRLAEARKPYADKILALELEIAEAKATDVGQLRAEVSRLTERYETPCPGLAHTDDGVVRCGGFLGHPGDCAPVW